MDKKSLMTEREKEYVAGCFIRSAGINKTGIDFGKIMAGEKITYDFVNTSKEMKQVFGKQGKRSRKVARPGVNSSSDFMKNELILCELFDVLSVLNTVDLAAESRTEMEETLCSYFISEFTNICELRKTVVFLQRFFKMCPGALSERIYIAIFENSEVIGKSDVLENILECVEILEFNASDDLLAAVNNVKMWSTSKCQIVHRLIAKRLFKSNFSSFAKALCKSLTQAKNEPSEFLDYIVSQVISAVPSSKRNEFQQKVANNKSE
ncbi:hypothetical protein ENBRE01_0198 [Enteropsectra breve]|nr:hypothetical protein ENBRE01_0198 [Enteropsectra breve]